MSSSPKVVQVVLSLGPGGTERLVVDLIHKLRNDVEMAVCCLDEEGAWGEALKQDGVDVQALRREAGFHPTLSRQISQIAVRHGAQVLHCHQYSPFVYGCLAPLWHPSLSVLFTEHGRLSDAPPSAKRKIANRFLSRMPNQVFAVCADLKQHLLAEGFPASKVGVLYNGIEIQPLPDERARRGVRVALGIPERTFLVGTIARLDPVKDLDVLIRATTALNQFVSSTLLVVGDGSQRHRLEELVAALKGGRFIRFLGHREDARDLLAGCDVYANSSISEGVSLTILEAMAAGIPVVATRVGGTPEVIDESCARLVPARNVEAMTAALRELADSPETRSTLGRVGRARVEERFTLDRMVGEYRDAYFRAAGA